MEEPENCDSPTMIESNYLRKSRSLIDTGVDSKPQLSPLLIKSVPNPPLKNSTSDI